MDIDELMYSSVDITYLAELLSMALESSYEQISKYLRNRIPVEQVIDVDVCTGDTFKDNETLKDLDDHNNAGYVFVRNGCTVHILSIHKLLRIIYEAIIEHKSR